MSAAATTVATASVSNGLRGLGYGSDVLIEGYEFSDVGSPGAGTRSVDLAAFTHSPPSYRSAAFGLISGNGERSASGHRGWLASLGAPVVFVVTGNSVEVLRIGPSGPPTSIATLAPDDVPAFIERQRSHWSPDALRRLKLHGPLSQQEPPQLDFFDRGLLPAVEADAQRHLATLLGSVLDDLRGDKAELSKAALSLVFRLLAAKVFIDRRHPDAAAWGADAATALKGVEAFYGFGAQSGGDGVPSGMGTRETEAAWSRMRSSMTLRNVSSDDLAFVYENSFVTKEARLELGTHSTPRGVAEYACDRLPFDALDPDAIRVFEPFAGAGVFLIAAMRRLAERVPHLSAPDRHSYLLERMAGSDIDGFACQLAQLALILADYPNHNGWHVESRDLFASTEWTDQIGPTSIVFCNPPYERFSEADRGKYAAVIGGATSKPLWVASKILERRPAGVALVLPRSFALEGGWGKLRAEVEAAYDDIEVLALPENTFAIAGFETCLVIGKSLRAAGPSSTRVTGSFVRHSDLSAFKAAGSVSWKQTWDHPYVPGKSGPLWKGDLAPTWADLARRCEPLSSRWEAHRGIEWVKGRQKEAWSSERREGWRPGYHPNTGMHAFQAPRPGWLDVTSGLRGNAHLLPWDSPKVLLNAARRSRGPWKLTAFAERGDMAASQQFIGLWPKTPGASLDAIAAVLNGPVANAFLFEASFGKGLRLEDLEQVPLPPGLDEAALETLVGEYRALLEQAGFDAQLEEGLRRALLRIDAFVLSAYRLPPREEKLLLNLFGGHQRQVPFAFGRFYAPNLPALPLRAFLDGAMDRAQWSRLAPAFDALGAVDPAELARFWKSIR